MKTLNTFLIAVIILFISNANIQAQQILVGNKGDISVFVEKTYEYPDDLQCMIQADFEYKFVIDNVNIGDTIKVIKYFNSQQDVHVVPVNHNSPDITIVHPYFDFVHYDYGNYCLCPGPDFINKVIANGDTLDFMIDVLPSPMQADVILNCTYGDITGKVFIDNNGDCQYSNGEDGILTALRLNMNYVIGNRSEYYHSYANGDINISIKSNDFLNGTMSLSPIYDFAYNIPSCSQISFPVTLNGNDFDPIIIARECAADIDVQVAIANTHLIRPLIPFKMYPRVSNVGCQPASGILELVLDPNVTYDELNSSNPADSISGNSLFWKYENLTNVGTTNNGYWNSLLGSIHLTPNTNVNIGDSLTFTVNTNIHPNDINPNNNTNTIKLAVVNSYDPNIKVPSPRGIGEEGFIPAETEKITYTIHFQNTGNAPALNVYILDTIKENIIPQTLRILGTSHKMDPQWLTDNVVKFNFPNINLADSISNEPESHGYVTFEIDLVSDLEPGTEIKNTAHIYFDHNPAIVTNTAINTIELEDEEDTTVGITENKTEKDGLKVYPNPTNNFTTFEFQNNSIKEVSIKIFDITGKLVKSIESKNSSKVTINRQGMNNGVYIYKVLDDSNNIEFTGKLIIQ